MNKPLVKDLATESAGIPAPAVERGEESRRTTGTNICPAVTNSQPRRAVLFFIETTATLGCPRLATAGVRDSVSWPRRHTSWYSLAPDVTRHVEDDTRPEPVQLDWQFLHIGQGLSDRTLPFHRADNQQKAAAARAG